MDYTPTSTPGPRRSQRDRKTVKPFASGGSASVKRKHKQAETDAEDDAPDIAAEGDEGDQDVESQSEPEENDEGFQAPKQKRKRAKNAGSKTKGAPPAKRPRTAEAEAERHTKPTGRRGRRVKEKGEGYDVEQIAKDTKIATDNTLFNALIDSTVALQDAVQDFIRSLQETPEAAQAELVNLILRCCGCNDSVDANQAVDYDGVVDALDNFTEILKQENSPIYPLTSKLPVFKPFRASLSEFIDRLVLSTADLGVLYTSDFMSTLQTWVIAMSSSQIRSFRHTATVLALEVETSLCDAAAAVDKEAEVVSRQREGEKKRKGSGKGSSARDKELEAKAREIRERRTKLAEYLKETVDGVFVHRYRDLDPNIRAECVRSIGQWFKKYPGHFLNASYLRYVGWVLSDANTHVRLEAVKSLSSVYNQDDYVGTLTHFTERFKPRLLEMATSDIELSVRVAVIQVLEAIDAQSLLEEEEREKLCLLVFDEEMKVRKAVGGFVKRVWKENVEEQQDEERIGLKALVALFEKWGKALSELAGDAGESENGDDMLVNGQDENESVDGPSRRASRRKEVLALVGTDKKGRVILAVEALWDEVDALRDWEGVLEMLLLDHSSGQQNATGGSRVNGKEPTPPEQRELEQEQEQEQEMNTVSSVVVKDCWRLEEGEETILLEILVTCVRQTKADAVGGKKGEEETVVNDITRELIKALPRLFIKYQTDQNRIANVLIIPTLMSLDLYLEMRMISAYNALWDDIIKQFMSHTSVTVLSHAITTIKFLMDATSLSNANSTKILELEDELATALRDTIAGRDEIEVATLKEDEVLALGGHCSRVGVLFGIRNLTAWMEEDESGKQSCAWDIVCAVVERGRLGYKEEEGMVEQALHVLTLHVIWKSKDLTRVQPGKEFTPDEEKVRDVVKQQRDSLVEKLFEFAIGTQSNTAEGVRRAAFKYLLDLHILFAPTQLVPDLEFGSVEEVDPMSLKLDDETQYRCAGYIQAEIERFAELLEEDAAAVGRAETPEKGGSDDEHASGEDEDENGREKEKEKEKEKERKMDTESRSWLEREYLFIDVISTFLRAIRAGAISVNHGSVLLAHYGRLGVAFDTCVKVVVDVLREEGLMGDNGDIVVTVVTKAIQEAFSLVIDGYVEDEYNAIQLTKLLSSCYVIRGGQLAIIKRLKPEYIVQIQTNLIGWIVKRIAAYQSNKNKKGLRRVLLFFRVLAPLLSSIQNRDALKIKAHLDQAFDQAKVEVSPTLKVWEPQRQYEKRLNNVMNKDKAGEGRRRKADRGNVSAGELTSADEESEVEKLVDTDGEQAAGGTKKSRPKPRLRPVGRGTRRTRANPNPEEDEEGVQEQVTPRATRTRSSPQQNAEESAPSPSPAAGGGAESLEPEPGLGPVATGQEPSTPTRPAEETEEHEEEETGAGETIETPKASKTRKRSREEEVEGEEGVEGEVGPQGEPHVQKSSTPGHDRPSTPVDALNIRRKRIRR
ncbi:Cohesin subunit psc3 [Leucoagaricus sp. SymC.cos]|nr:Cohesin subunit psc3 [Leucoagaricus sp. SymC.cos]